MELPKEGRFGKNKIIGKIMLKVSSFPSMPQAAVKTMALIQQEDIAIDDKAQVLRHDPGLTTNVLKLANSAYFGIAAQGVDFEVAENMVLGTDHAEIGAQILANWAFPRDIIDAVRWHHNPERIKNSKLHAEIVYLSNLLCEACGDGEFTESKPLMPSTVVLDRLGIKVEQYELISSRVSNWMNKLADTLTFD